MNGKEKTDNPWLTIPAADYEAHMSNPAVGQLQFLSGVIGQHLDQFDPESVAVVGCATGNGFEHIDPARVKRIVGIDINPRFLEIVRRRFARTLPGLELVCTDVSNCRLEPQSLDFVHCGLILEYVDPKTVFHKAAGWLRHGGILAVVLQLPSEGKPNVTQTEYTSLKRLEPIMKLVDPRQVETLAERHHFGLVRGETRALESGKEFYVGVFRLEV